MKSLRLLLRRWRCDHFDHPYTQVRDTTKGVLEDIANALIGAPIEDKKWCGYCKRNFTIPIMHPNCRCVVLPLGAAKGVK